MDLQSINRIEQQLDLAWDQVSVSWKDSYQKEFEYSMIYEMKNVIDDIRNILSDCISDFEAYENEQNRFASIIAQYKSLDNNY